jgi:hypothetical protein
MRIKIGYGLDLVCSWDSDDLYKYPKLVPMNWRIRSFSNISVSRYTTANYSYNHFVIRL